MRHWRTHLYSLAILIIAPNFIGWWLGAPQYILVLTISASTSGYLLASALCNLFQQVDNFEARKRFKRARLAVYKISKGEPDTRVKGT